MSPDEKKFGAALMAWREKSGLSRDALAQKLGVEEKTVQHVELGYQRLGKAARKLAEQVMGTTSPDAAIYPHDIDYQVLDAIIAIFVDSENQKRAKVVSDTLSIPIERAWKLLISEKIRQ